jgi:uncharacterized protein YlxW (UPF0749 family)
LHSGNSSDPRSSELLRQEVKLLLFVLLIMFGISISVMIKNIGTHNEVEEIFSQYEAIRNELNTLVHNNESLLRQQKTLENKRRDLLDSLEITTKRPELIQELRSARLLAGLETVTGTGLTITMNDKEGYDPLVDKSDALIHDGTITYIINLLNGAGARALSFNGTRITAVPQIYCIGPTILFYSRRLAPPYVIIAIGPIEEMLAVLETDRYLQRITSNEVGIRMEIQTGQVVIPAFSEYENFREHITHLEATRNED